MADSFVIPGTKAYRVIIMGPYAEAIKALGDHGIHRPLRDTSMNGYGAVHATCFAGLDQLEEWWVHTTDNLYVDGTPQPGALLYYGEVDGTIRR